jgi:hypothetical protein
MEAANPPKRRYACTKIRGETFYKTGIWKLTNITTFCDMTTCKLVRFHQRLGETCCFQALY